MSEVTTIPEMLIETRGNQSEVARRLDTRRETVRKYVYDYTGAYHVVVKGRLYTRRGGYGKAH